MIGAKSELVEELFDFLRIPSISADPHHAEDLWKACGWISDLVSRIGGEVEVRSTGLSPLLIGTVPASSPGNAPTVLVYGHYDVQPPGDLDEWNSSPFDPEIRDDWIYARGASDDKGNLFVLLKAIELLRVSGDLGVNVIVLSDGEEEIGGHSAIDFLDQIDRHIDACVIFDGQMLQPKEPVFCIGTRGLCYFRVTVEAAEDDLHSGTSGGMALNASHVLIDALNRVISSDGEIPDPLMDGIDIGRLERGIEEALPDGSRLLRQGGARLASPSSAEQFYQRTWNMPSVDINGIRVGDVDVIRTAIPARAEATVSMRLAFGQTAEAIAQTFESTLLAGCPPEASIQVQLLASSDPAFVDEDSPVLEAAARSFERHMGVRPLIVRNGGTLPILTALSQRRIPTIMSGFSEPIDNVHGPNERFRVSYVNLGILVAADILRRLAKKEHK